MIQRSDISQFLKGMAAKRVSMKIVKLKTPKQSKSLKIPKASSGNLRFKLGGVKKVKIPKVK